MTEVERAFAEDTRVQEMLDVEAALARAEAQAGIIPASAAEAIRARPVPSASTSTTIVADAHSAGNLAIPLVKAAHPARRGRQSGVGRYVHWGATSQDIIDTGLVLQLRRCGSDRRP